MPAIPEPGFPALRPGGMMAFKALEIKDE